MTGSAHTACIVLAAGRSTRMGAANKLLADIGGTPMVRRVVEAALASEARPVLVVTGHKAADVSAALAGLDVTLVANPDYATGLASSLKAGIRALPGRRWSAGSARRHAADRARAPRSLIAAFAAEDGAAIVVPTHAGQAGQPRAVAARLFSRRYCNSRATLAPSG